MGSQRSLGGALLGRRALQNLILAAAARRDTAAILTLLQEHRDALGPVSVATAAHRVARALRRAPAPRRAEAGCQLRGPLLAAAPEFHAQALANSVWALAALGEEDAELVSRLCEVAAPQLGSFRGQHLSNFAWALATLQSAPTAFLRALSLELAHRAEEPGRLSPQTLANVAWSYAALEEWEPLVFEAVAEGLLASLPQLSARDVANSLWAYAVHPDGRLPQHAPLFMALAVPARGLAAEMPPQDLSNIAWAFADAMEGAGRRAAQGFESVE